MIRGVALMPGIPAAGHIGRGFWHPGAIDTCPKCDLYDTASPSRGANLMNNATDTAPEPSTFVPDPDRCQHEFNVADFDGGKVEYPCGDVVAQRPTLDDAYSAHIRATGETDERVQPCELPLCQQHYDELLQVIAGQDPHDPYRIWIAAMPVELVIGYTKVIYPEGAGADERYVPTMDGYQPGAKQHELIITVPLPPQVQPYRVAELVFIATNAPELDDGTPEKAIHDAIKATGYTGQEAHWSLSVGDTVAVTGGPRYACENTGWTEVRR